MSRYVIPALQPTHVVTVGYDQQLATFWANVEDLMMVEVEADPYIFQVGQLLQSLPSVQLLAQALAPYATLPLPVLSQLQADQLVPYQRSPLQERMVQFFEHLTPKEPSDA